MVVVGFRKNWEVDLIEINNCDVYIYIYIEYIFIDIVIQNLNVIICLSYGNIFYFLFFVI